MALASVHAADVQEDPQSYRAAMQDPRSDLWQEAINKELKSVKDTGTWQEVKFPEGASLVDSKWVFKTKLNERGEVIKYKARIVARGFTQEYGVDYFDTYSPVARLTSLRILLTIVAAQDLELYQMDADTAFLNGTLEEDIYMDFPDDTTGRTRSLQDSSLSDPSMVSNNHPGYGGSSSAHTWKSWVSPDYQQTGDSTITRRNRHIYYSMWMMS